MRNTTICLSAIVTFVLLSACSATRNLPKNEVLTSMQLTNQYFMNKWPDAGKSIITNKERPSNIWTRAVYYEGLMALYSIDPKKKSTTTMLYSGEINITGVYETVSKPVMPMTRLAVKHISIFTLLTKDRKELKTSRLLLS